MHLKVYADERGKHYVSWGKAWSIPTWIPRVINSYKALEQVGSGVNHPLFVPVIQAQWFVQDQVS